MFHNLLSASATQQRPVPYEQLGKIFATDATAGDMFGGNNISLSDDGIVLLVGAHGDDDKGSNSGAAYIFNKQSNGIYTQQQKIVSTSLVALDFFGYACAISGDGNVAVVGAYGDDTNSMSGAAYIFTKQVNGNYSQTQKLKASDGTNIDYFGKTVTVSYDGSIVIVGMESGKSGKAYVFTMQPNGTYTQTQILTASGGKVDDYFGSMLSISSDGGILAIGAKYEDGAGTNAGAVYVFVRQPNGTYTQTQKLTASNAAPSSSFGFSIAMTGDAGTILVGAYNASVAGKSAAGAAYVFNKQSSGTYTQAAILSAPSPKVNAWFGYSIAISKNGENVTISAYGEGVNSAVQAGVLYTFIKKSNGYEEVSRIYPTDYKEDSRIGYGSQVIQVSDDGTILCGAMHDAMHGTGAGAVYIFG